MCVLNARVANVHLFSGLALALNRRSCRICTKNRPSISKRIGEYVLAGITDVTEIRRLLRLYVNENFSKDVHRGETPKLCHRSLYPQDSDIL